MFMLSGAGSCLTSALASCAAVFACEACKCVAGSITRTSARACYVLYFAMSITVAWIMRDYAQPLMKKIPWIMHTLSSALKKGIYAAASGSSVLSNGDGAYDFGLGGADSHDAAAAAAASDEWLGKQAVYRVTCGTAVFFGVMAVLTAGVSFRNDPRDKTVQHGAWGLKTLLYIICLATPFFFPTTMIAGYVWIARVCGGLFLILQMVILLEFAQTWNDSWVNKEHWHWLAGLLGVTIACYGISIAIMVFMYIYFVPAAACSLNTFFIVMATILCLGFTAASLHPAIPNGSVFPSGIVTLYSFFLLYSALSSEPKSYECNALGQTKWDNPEGGATLAIGMGVTLLSVVYSALRAGSSDIWGGSGCEDGSGSGESIFSPVRDEEQPLVGPGEITAERSSGNEAVVDYEPVSYNYSFFHMTFALAAMYVAMLMTGWSTSSVLEVNSIDVGWASAWVKICSQWFAGLLYTWTLVAPIILPDRDFS